MAPGRFFNREQQPTTEEIRKRIGKEVLPVWDDVREFLAQQFPEYEPEMIFYSDQEGWAYRYRKELTQLCTLFPERGAFSVLILLNPEAEGQALEKIDYFNARLRELLNRQSALPGGRWLWMRLEDHTDFVGLKLLLDIKNS